MDRTVEEIILACLRGQPGSPGEDRLRALAAEGCNWEAVVDLSLRNAVVPPVYSGLKRTGVLEHISEGASSRLREAFRANVQNSLRLANELLRLLAALESRGIQGLPYKGPVLSCLLYGDCWHRQYVDLDVFVRRKDLDAARRVMADIGYRKMSSSGAIQDEADAWREKADTLVRADGNVVVELHWDVTGPQNFASSGLDIERCWDRCERRPLLSGSVLAPQAEDLIVMLAVHAAKHHWQKLAWTCDIAQLLRQSPSMDWDRVFSETRRLGIERLLLMSLLLAVELLDAPLSADAAARLESAGPLQPLAGQVRSWMFRESTVPVPAWETYALALAVRERFVDRARALWTMMLFRMRLSDRDRASFPLPSAMAPLRYLWRPLRLFSEYGIAPLRVLLKSLFSN